MHNFWVTNKQIGFRPHSPSVGRYILCQPRPNLHQKRGARKLRRLPLQAPSFAIKKFSFGGHDLCSGVNYQLDKVKHFKSIRNIFNKGPHPRWVWLYFRQRRHYKIWRLSLPHRKKSALHVIVPSWDPGHLISCFKSILQRHLDFS